MSSEKEKVLERSTNDDEKKPKQAQKVPTTAAEPKLNNDKSKKSVSFTSSPPKNTKNNKPTRRQPPQLYGRNPAKVGKANPARDIPIFLGLVAFLLLVAWSFNGIGGTTEVEKKKSIREVQEDLRKQFEVIQAREKARKRTMECDLFLASSSIPGAGVGVFAGKRFEIGDEVLHPGSFYPMQTSRQDTAETVHVTQYGFLLKHHPYLANVQGGPIWVENAAALDASSVSVLRATRLIEPGDELFLSFDQHPQSRSNAFSLPTLEDYELADAIVRDEIKTQRRGAAAKRFGGRLAGGDGTVLLLMKRNIALFNKRVAALLPGSPKVLETRDFLVSHTVYSALTNRTVNYLETNGQCLDDVYEKESDSSQIGLFARRSIKKGNVIVPVPLYARHDERSCLANDESCTASTVEQDYSKRCFGHKDSSLLLCPLSSAVHVQSSSNENESTKTANAALKWSSIVDVKNLKKITVDDVLENYTTSLRLDLVALRAIQPGEQLLISGTKGSIPNDGFVQVEDSIYPDAWKDYKLAE